LKSINNIINIVINRKIPTHALVDTGAGSLCVDEQYVIQHKMKITRLLPNDDHAFIIADNSTIKVIGKALIDLTIGNEIFEHSFHVISNLSVDIILGDDFLDINDAIIHRGEKTFSLLKGMIQVPLCVRGPPQIIAITPYDVTIPPNSQQILQVQFPYCRTKKVLLLEPLDNQNALGFKVARTLVSTQGRKFCPVWNDSDQPLTLYYGTPIATVSPIADIIRSCTDKKSIGEVRTQTSTIDPEVNKKYIHNLNVLNKNINAYNTSQQQDARIQTNDTNGHTRRHPTTHNIQYAQNNARHSHNNEIQRPNKKITHKHTTLTIHIILHH